MTEEKLRIILAACAVAVTILFLDFKVRKNQADDRAAVAWERLADKFAPKEDWECMRIK